MTRPYGYVCRQEDVRWLAERRLVFTASEIAAFFGEGYKTQKSILREKLYGEASPPVEMGSQAWWGLELEKANMLAFSKLTGMRSKHINAFLVSKKLPNFGCTIDGLGIVPELCSGRVIQLRDEGMGIYDRPAGEVGLLEMKNVDQFDLSGQDNLIRWQNGFDWTPGLPRYRWIQVQSQLYVTGYPWALLVAKIGACSMVAVYIEPDPLFFEDLEAVVKKAQSKLDKMRAEMQNQGKVTK